MDAIFRSFEPFVRILNETSLVGAQMWCLWGVNHVLSHSDANSVSMGYMTMLMESDLLEHCIRLSKNTTVDEGVRALAIQIEIRWLERAVHGMRVDAALTDQHFEQIVPEKDVNTPNSLVPDQRIRRSERTGV
ncbi:hypothetical protein COOONC_05451 [Cooperia oncophora]